MQIDAELGREPRRGEGDQVAILAAERGAARFLVAHQRAGHLGRLHIGRAIGGGLAHQRLERRRHCAPVSVPERIWIAAALKIAMSLPQFWLPVASSPSRPPCWSSA